MATIVKEDQPEIESGDTWKANEKSSQSTSADMKTMTEYELVGKTRSMCPECLKIVPANIVQKRRRKTSFGKEL